MNVMFMTCGCGRVEFSSARRKEKRYNTSRIGALLMRFVYTRKRAGIFRGGTIAPGCFDATWGCESIIFGSARRWRRGTRGPGLTLNLASGKSLRITRQYL